MADGVTMRLESLKFNGRAFSKKVNRELEGAFIDATRAFLIATVRRIPIRTGFLRGAFTRLEDLVGAFEVGKSTLRKGVTGKEALQRPERETANIGRRLVRLRETQRRLIKKIKTIHSKEASRRRLLNKKISELQDRQHSTIHEKQLVAILRVNRAAALHDRNRARFFLAQAVRNQENIAKAARQFETKTQIKLGSIAEDRRTAYKIKILSIQQKRNERFQVLVKKLKEAHFGKISRTPGQFATRSPGTINGEEFNRRLNKLRDVFGKPTKLQARLTAKLAGGIVSKKVKERLETYKKRLQKKYAQRLIDAANSDDENALKELTRQIQKKIIKASRGKIKKTQGDRLLKLLQDQTRVLDTHTNEQLDELQHQLNIAEGRLNVVARTNTGRIVGQNVPGRFNLRAGETVKKIFNQPGHDRREEFYYPIKGTPEARILKTPRSGRKFATPSNLIIQKVTTPTPTGSLGLLRQLTQIARPSSLSLSPDVINSLNAIKDTTTYYRFFFQVDISYLPINDQRLSWQAWNAGILAFHQTLVARVQARLPKFSEFLSTVTTTLKGQTVSKSTSTVEGGR